MKEKIKVGDVLVYGRNEGIKYTVVKVERNNCTVQSGDTRKILLEYSMRYLRTSPWQLIRNDIVPLRGNK